MPRATVDMHLHTTASDGTVPPRRLVRRAVKRGIRVMAITDHDTTAGIPEALEETSRFQVDIIPGIEINTEHEGAEVHVLGYFIDIEHGPLQSALTGIRQAREQRIHQILARLQEHGLDITIDDVTKYAKGPSMGRPHVAQALVQKKMALHFGDAFDRWLSRDRPGYVPRASLRPADAIRLIREAGGIPVLAHPMWVGGEDAIEPLIRAGLQGIEAHYPQHTQLQREMYRDIADRHGMVVTGGSDFHGPQVKKNIDVGDVDFTLADLRVLCERLGREVPRLARAGGGA